MQSARGILDEVTSSLAPEVPPVRLPGQRELPSEDGQPMETQRHRAQMAHLIESLDSAMRDRDDVYVSGNMFVYFSPRQLSAGVLATEGPDGSARTRADGRDRRGEPMGSKNEFFRGPDVFVVVGAEKKERLSWVLWEELRLPDVVIELTSPSTREEDYGRKKDVYERVWKTAVYVIYDPATHQLDAWVLEGGRYVPARRDARGDVEVAILGLSLGLRELPLSPTLPAPSLRWIDASGEPLEHYDALATRARDAEARTRDAEARADALAAELERVRRG